MQGDIKIHEMLSISRCDDENMRDPKYSHCFEVKPQSLLTHYEYHYHDCCASNMWFSLSQVNTQSRGYLFCADSKEDMEDWIVTLEKVSLQIFVCISVYSGTHLVQTLDIVYVVSFSLLFLQVIPRDGAEKLVRSC